MGPRAGVDGGGKSQTYRFYSLSLQPVTSLYFFAIKTIFLDLKYKKLISSLHLFPKKEKSFSVYYSQSPHLKLLSNVFQYDTELLAWLQVEDPSAKHSFLFAVIPLTCGYQGKSKHVKSYPSFSDITDNNEVFSSLHQYLKTNMQVRKFQYLVIYLLHPILSQLVVGCVMQLEVTTVCE